MTTEQQRENMRAMLGNQANRWTYKGIEFLCKRTNGSQREISQMIINAYLSGEISQVPITARSEAGQRFNRNNLSDECIVVILLGRAPDPDGYGRMEERSQELTITQDQAAAQLVQYVPTLNGRRYINRSRL
ncbi:MAG: hypothetical protein WAW42_16700 [Candidatus Competibacteraceae bacterium]